jgi:hypothetical protein
MQFATRLEHEPIEISGDFGPPIDVLFLRAASAEQSFSANRFEAPSLNYS